MIHLQMIDTKTEFITFSTSNLLHKKDLDSITVGGITTNCSKTVKFWCLLGCLLGNM